MRDDFLAHTDGGADRLLALIDNAKPAEPGSAEEILSRASIPELTAQSGIDVIEAALRRLRHETTDVDRLRETAVRSEVTKHLLSIGVQSPAQLVSAALSRLENQDETHGSARDSWRPLLAITELAGSTKSVFAGIPALWIQKFLQQEMNTYV